MKKETAEERLNKLLGIDPEMIARDKARKAALEAKRSGKLQGISEEEIEKFREMQGIVYFLQAPALFHFKVCPHCKAEFFVSRLFVSHCSYTCIRATVLEELGHEWEKGNDLEALANDPQVWNGNEPIWIRNLPRLKAMLERISYEPTESLETDSPQTSIESSPTTTSQVEVTSSSIPTKVKGRRVVTVR